jgi:FkbM family methyltransferase
MLSSVKNILKSIGVFDAFQTAFYKLFRSKTAVEILGMEKVFTSDSPFLYHRVLNAGGEKQQLSDFLKAIKPDDIVWDVGAFMGMYSVFASEAAKSGKVYSFEPEQNSLQLLTKNRAYNNANNVNIINVALSNESEEGTIYPATSDANAIHSLRPGEGLKTKGATVKVVKGDDLVKQGQALPPNVIKIDVEGAEAQMIQGLKDNLSSPNCRFLFIEIHPKDLLRFGSSEDEVKSLLHECGFTINNEIKRGSEIHAFCSK